MSTRRGLGSVFRPKYRDKRTGEIKEQAVWWVVYHYRGRRFRESSRSTRRSDAVRLLEKRIGAMGQGQFVGPDAERLTFDDLASMLLENYRLNGYRSLKSRATVSVNRLREFFGLYRAVDITTKSVTEYIRQREAGGAKPATIRNELAALKRMFTLAVETGQLQTRPHVPTIKVQNVRTHFVDEDDFWKIHGNLDSHLQPLVRFLYLTAWRLGEAKQLRWADVDFDVGIIRLRPGTTKSREPRTFPFDVLPELEDLLQEQRHYTDAIERVTEAIVPYVFHRNGKSIRDFRGAWKTACHRAGLDGVWVHDLRRSGVRRLLRSGVHQTIAMKISGHKTESTFRRYGIVTEDDLREAVEKVAEFRRTERKPSARKVVSLSSR